MSEHERSRCSRFLSQCAREGLGTACTMRDCSVSLALRWIVQPLIDLRSRAEGSSDCRSHVVSSSQVRLSSIRMSARCVHHSGLRKCTRVRCSRDRCCACLSQMQIAVHSGAIGGVCCSSYRRQRGAPLPNITEGRWGGETGTGSIVGPARKACVTRTRLPTLLDAQPRAHTMTAVTIVHSVAPRCP